MEQKRNLTDIGNALANAMDNPIAKTIRSGAIGVVGIANPFAGVAAGVGHDLLSQYNYFKLSYLLKGLSTGKNIEMRLNELYNFVTSGQENAINVANLFRKTVNAECPKVCIIYGLILAKHVESNTEFNRDEMIVCRALESVTECDLINFKIIMEHYLKPTSDGNRIVFPNGFADLAEFATTCEWGVYSRLFVFRALEWKKMESITEGINTDYYTAKPASVLMEYINNARQIWDYGERVQD